MHREQSFPWGGNGRSHVQETTGRSALFRHHHHSLLLPAVHFDGHGMFEADVAQVFRLVQGGLGVEVVLVVEAVVHVGVDGEVAHAERCQVLEEVGALAGVHAVVGQAGFHDDAAALMWGHFTGMPSHVSLLPQRPGPTST